MMDWFFHLNVFITPEPLQIPYHYWHLALCPSLAYSRHSDSSIQTTNWASHKNKWREIEKSDKGMPWFSKAVIGAFQLLPFQWVVPWTIHCHAAHLLLCFVIVEFQFLCILVDVVKVKTYVNHLFDQGCVFTNKTPTPLTKLYFITKWVMSGGVATGSEIAEVRVQWITYYQKGNLHKVSP